MLKDDYEAGKFTRASDMQAAGELRQMTVSLNGIAFLIF